MINRIFSDSERIKEEKKIGRPLAVQLEPLRDFFSAEDYHQKYLEKNPGGYCHIPDRYYHLADRK